MSPNREDYIKVIFNHNENKEKINNKKLAELLGVSAASTSEMVRKLIESKHVVRAKDFSLSLTDKGRQEAENLVTKHRLWEVFLVEYLNYTWTEVHDDAEVLEHVTSDLLMERLNKFLEYPEYCPHGEVVYGNVLDFSDDSLPLVEMKTGEKGIFKRVSDTADLLKYLDQIDFELKDEFTLLAKLPYEGPLRIQKQDKVIEISYKAAHDIYIEKL